MAFAQKRQIPIFCTAYGAGLGISIEENFGNLNFDFYLFAKNLFPIGVPEGEDNHGQRAEEPERAPKESGYPGYPGHRSGIREGGAGRGKTKIDLD